MGIINLIENKLTMKSTLALIATVAVVAADHGFPRDDAFHSKCHLTATLMEGSCADAKAKAAELISSNVDTDSEYKGQMSIHSEGDDFIWSSRLTYNKKYTDDELFEFETVMGSEHCLVTARSKSESLSYLDSGVNYCNMWNIVSRISGFTKQTLGTSDCATVPSDPVTTCARY